VDYFAQDQYKELDPSARMLDDLSNDAPRKTTTELRTLLGCFLFSEDDVFKRIGVLSGGERNRYALAKMLLSPSNFLLLDEPTNHLDMRAKDVLLEAMAEFTGTVVFVSHDRYFIDKLATRVFEIEDGEVRVFPGNYEDYLWRKSGKPLDLPVVPVASGNGSGAARAEGAAPEKSGKRVNPMKVQKLRDQCAAVESDIASHEAEIAKLEAELADFRSTDETLRVTRLLEDKRAALEGLMSRWEEVSAEIEAAAG
jgi:ATP-binding cassette subfamily F protein 3